MSEANEVEVKQRALLKERLADRPKAEPEEFATPIARLPRVCPSGCDFGEGEPADECFNCGNTNPNHNRIRRDGGAEATSKFWARCSYCERKWNAASDAEVCAVCETEANVVFTPTSDETYPITSATAATDEAMRLLDLYVRGFRPEDVARELVEKYRALPENVGRDIFDSNPAYTDAQLLEQGGSVGEVSDLDALFEREKGHILPNEYGLASDYRAAILCEGPQASEWQDKPHRLLYDLLRVVDVYKTERDAALKENVELEHHFQGYKNLITRCLGAGIEFEDDDEPLVNKRAEKAESDLEATANQLNAVYIALGHSKCSSRPVSDVAGELKATLALRDTEIVRLKDALHGRRIRCVWCSEVFTGETFKEVWAKVSAHVPTCALAPLQKMHEEITRLTDLVRYNRHKLLFQGLISQGEFTALVMDSDGGNRVGRLEGYGAMRRRAEKAELENARLLERAARVTELEEAQEGWCANAMEYKERAEKAELENADLRTVNATQYLREAQIAMQQARLVEKAEAALEERNNRGTGFAYVPKAQFDAKVAELENVRLSGEGINKILSKGFRHGDYEDTEREAWNHALDWVRTELMSLRSKA